MKTIHYIFLLASVNFLHCAQSGSSSSPESAAPAPSAPAPSALTPASPFDGKKAEGVDFTGLGTEPFWSIDLDFDKMMRFTTADGEDIRTPAVMGNRNMDGAVTYAAKTEANKLKVTFKKEKCSDGMSDVEYEYVVSVEVNDKSYNGCGTYLAGSLGSVWVLKTINGQAPAQNAFPEGKIPVLTIMAGENRWGGSDGCNSGGGKATVNGNNIKLEPGASTMMACPGDGIKAYQQALHSATSYKLEGNQLTLMAGEKEVLVFGL